MIQKIFNRLGYVRKEPGLVQLTVDEVDVLTEALTIYQERLPCKKYGYFSQVAEAAQAKLQKIGPALFSRFVQSDRQSA